jgi:hypothetical protein
VTAPTGPSEPQPGVGLSEPQPGVGLSEPERVSRLARAILSDVMLYHADEVRRGIEADDLFERLAPELSEARLYFESRVEPDVARALNAWNRALVDVLVYRSRHVRSRIW